MDQLHLATGSCCRHLSSYRLRNSQCRRSAHDEQSVAVSHRVRARSSGVPGRPGEGYRHLGSDLDRDQVSMTQRPSLRLPDDDVLQQTRRYLDLIAGRELSLEEKQAFIAETVDSYEKHYNRGFVAYRKSVTEAGQFA